MASHVIEKFPVAKITMPAGVKRAGVAADELVSYQAMPLPPALKSLYVTSPGALAGAAVSRTLSAGASMLEVGDLSQPVVLNWDMSFEGMDATFESTEDTFADALADSNYDVLVLGAQQPIFFPVPDGAVGYTYQNVGSAGTAIIIER
ncbi:MAG: hypothetical protein HGB02_08560 [Chlorobiaceae bacterium]|nr:hypothetical protein [Chlorobiaceae bacterium]